MSCYLWTLSIIPKKRTNFSNDCIIFGYSVFFVLHCWKNKKMILKEIIGLANVLFIWYILSSSPIEIKTDPQVLFEQVCFIFISVNYRKAPSLWQLFPFPPSFAHVHLCRVLERHKENLKSCSDCFLLILSSLLEQGAICQSSTS